MNPTLMLGLSCALLAGCGPSIGKAPSGPGTSMAGPLPDGFIVDTSTSSSGANDSGVALDLGVVDSAAPHDSSVPEDMAHGGAAVAPTLGTLGPLSGGAVPSGKIGDYLESSSGTTTLLGSAPGDNSATIDGTSIKLVSVLSQSFEHQWALQASSSSAFPHGVAATLSGSAIGDGCANGNLVRLVVYTAGDAGTPTIYESDGTAGCGLTVSVLSTTSSGGLRATFNGTVTDSGASPASHTLVASFDVLN